MKKEKRVAIIDDDAEFSRMLSEILKDEKYDVEYYNDEPEISNKEQPDVVLLDLWLGSNKSTEIARRIRKAWKNTKLIMMSSDHYVRKEAEKVMADYVLFKPFRIPLLLKAISK